jgi:hypothetical protein
MFITFCTAMEFFSEPFSQFAEHRVSLEHHVGTLPYGIVYDPYRV